MNTKDFRDIDFGYASAEQEGARAPRLLLKGYLDIHDVCQRSLSEDEFLILGYKGSGKSSISERLRLLHDADSNVFITNVNLEDFPYMSFSQVIRENETPQAKYPAAWSWILLIYLLASFEKDQDLQLPQTEFFDDTIEALGQMGLLPITGLPRLVRSTTEKTFKLSIPKFFEGQWKTQDASVDIPNYVENLKRLIATIRSGSKHLLIVDGLDEIVTAEDAQWDSLGALVFEVNRLNKLFKQELVPAKIVLLCRTDFFELLDGANKNKIRQDSSIYLDWYSDPNSPNQSLLVKIANLRATLSLGVETNIFREFLPESIFRRPVAKLLLNCTRHTPRDFLQLLKYIQNGCLGKKPSIAQTKNGIRRYSQEYFLPEIFDELQGYVSSSDAKEFFKVVGALRSRDFYAKQVYDQIELEASPLSKEQADIIMKALFECSAIGNVQNTSKGTQFLTFRYRNRHSTFNIKERLIVHRGLWRALNLPSDDSWEDEDNEDVQFCRLISRPKQNQDG